MHSNHGTLTKLPYTQDRLRDLFRALLSSYSLQHEYTLGGAKTYRIATIGMTVIFSADPSSRLRLS